MWRKLTLLLASGNSLYAVVPKAIAVKPGWLPALVPVVNRCVTPVVAVHNVARVWVTGVRVTTLPHLSLRSFIVTVPTDINKYVVF